MIAWYVFNFLYSSAFATGSAATLSMSSSFFAPFSFNISIITLNTLTVVSTSSNALCATSTFIPRFSAIFPNLYFL